MQHGLTGIEYLLDLNRRNSYEFMSPAVALARRQYRAKHTTEIAVAKCMDGRLNLPVITKIEMGIIQPFRNLGGRFNLGWHGFQMEIREWVNYSIGRGRNCLMIVTYHYSRGDKHRGCRGFGYDQQAAEQSSLELKRQFDRDFGQGVVYTVQLGIETDLEALILHGEDGRVVDLAKIKDSATEYLLKLLRDLYPTMPTQTVMDFLPLVQGNIAHVADIIKARRLPIETEHKEWMLGIGQGFDWLHEINTAILIGPFDPNIETAIKTGALLLQSNLNEGRINGDGVVLMASARYREASGPEPRLAEDKARFYCQFARDTILKYQETASLDKHLSYLANVVDANTRALRVIEQ